MNFKGWNCRARRELPGKFESANRTSSRILTSRGRIPGPKGNRSQESLSFVCIYIYIYIYMCVYPLSLNLYTYMYIYIYTHYVYNIYIYYIYIYICMYIHILCIIYIYIYACVLCIYIYIYICMYVNTITSEIPSMETGRGALGGFLDVPEPERSGWIKKHTYWLHSI